MQQYLPYFDFKMFDVNLSKTKQVPRYFSIVRFTYNEKTGYLVFHNGVLFLKKEIGELTGPTNDYKYQFKA